MAIFALPISAVPGSIALFVLMKLDQGPEYQDRTLYGWMIGSITHQSSRGGPSNKQGRIDRVDDTPLNETLTRQPTG